MAALSETIDSLLRLPVEERRTVLRALIDDLDADEAAAPDAAEARRAELARRLRAIEDGSATVIEDADAWASLRARIAKRTP